MQCSAVGLMVAVTLIAAKVFLLFTPIQHGSPINTREYRHIQHIRVPWEGIILFVQVFVSGQRQYV
jgi:hypothetical protein